jgi:hypothetical protein
MMVYRIGIYYFWSIWNAERKIATKIILSNNVIINAAAANSILWCSSFICIII